MGPRMQGFSLSLALASACTLSVPQGQYGPYIPGQEKQLRLSTGDSFVVYRVKYWLFSSGEPPSLQLEYEALDPIADSAALRRRARELWPAFAPYVEALGLRGGIITATRLKRRGFMGVWTVTTTHFGLLENRDSNGIWRFVDDTSPLPPGDFTRGPQIIEPTGKPLPFSHEPPRIDR